MANSGCPREVAEGSLARCGLALAQWSERWFPDPLVFAFMGIVFVFLTGIALGEGATKLAIQGGRSFWALIPFTMQMSPAPAFPVGSPNCSPALPRKVRIRCWWAFIPRSSACSFPPEEANG